MSIVNKCPTSIDKLEFVIFCWPDGLDGNGSQLEQIGQFLQVLPVHFGEIAKNRFIVCSSLKKSIDIFLPVLYEQFHVREKVLR